MDTIRRRSARTQRQAPRRPRWLAGLIDGACRICQPPFWSDLWLDRSLPYRASMRVALFQPDIAGNVGAHQRKE